VGYWNFEEGSGQGAYDATDYNNDGTLGSTSDVDTSDPKWTGGIRPLSGGVSGGGALKFDGTDDYVDAGNDASLQQMSSVAVEAWVNFNSITGGDTARSIYNKGGNVAVGTIWIYYNKSNGRLYFELDQVAPYYSWTPVVNQWYHLIFTYDGTNMKTYIDGKLVRDYEISGKTVNNTSQSAFIGGYYDGVSHSFDGLIDEVRIYNRALSAAEIRYHYNRGGPVGHWRFDEGSGQIAFDESANDNDGTLGSGTGVDSADPSWVQGKYGSALSFDGTDDYVDCGTPSFVSDQEGTVELWVYPATADWGELVTYSKPSSGTVDEFHFIVDMRTNAKYARTYLYQDGTIGDAKTPVDSLTVGNWYHIVWTSDGTNIKIFINGVEQTLTKSGTDGLWFGDATVDADTVAIGTLLRGGGPTGSFNGFIDDVRIYNYARTPEQILQDYNAGLSVHFK
jgi:hypothetical protein